MLEKIILKNCIGGFESEDEHGLYVCYSSTINCEHRDYKNHSTKKEKVHYCTKNNKIKYEN